jgi:glycine cleavage system H protein
MNLPKDLRYTNEHEWIKIDQNASDDDRIIAIIGITDFAQSELGDLVYVEVDTIGEMLQKDDVFGTVEAVKTVSDLFMPLSGEVVEINTQLESIPENINQDPYDGGWMIRIKMSNPSELDDLLDFTAYDALVNG